MKKYIKSTVAPDASGKRVIQISCDILIDDSVDQSELRRMIENYIDVAGEKGNSFRCLGTDFVDDLTSVYEQDYPELL